MERKFLQLQPRLQLLANLVPQGARLADIGTDHGYLPVYLIQQGRIPFAIAADVGQEPLQHAVRTAEEYGVAGIDFRLCDGLMGVGADEVDTVVIAGDISWAMRLENLSEDFIEGMYCQGGCMNGPATLEEFTKSKIWNEMTLVYYNYIKYFETLDDKFEKEIFLHLDNIDELHSKGRAELGEAFYNYLGARGFTNAIPEFGGDFVACLKANYKYEKQVRAVLSKENLLDYVVCGTAYEGHKIQKEVNFADTYFVGEDVCRIPGNKSAKWSTINAHGWFSYEMKTNVDKDTQFTFLLGSSNDNLNVQITIGSDVHVIDKKITGKEEFSFIYPASGKDNVRVRIDRMNANTPFVYIIKTK